MPLNNTTDEIPYGYCQCGCGQLTPIAHQTDTKRGWIKNQPKRFVTGHHKRPDTVTRFWAKVDKRGPDECWEWTDFRDPFGYGKIGIDGKNKQAHRFSYELHYGSIAEGLCVCHHCDNPGCVNPAHLFLGTTDDNNKDRERKGRGIQGSTHHHAVLTEAQVIEIRRKYVRRIVTYSALASEYGVAKSTIAGIIERKAWQHI